MQNESGIRVWQWIATAIVVVVIAILIVAILGKKKDVPPLEQAPAISHSNDSVPVYPCDGAKCP